MDECARENKISGLWVVVYKDIQLAWILEGLPKLIEPIHFVL